MIASVNGINSARVALTVLLLIFWQILSPATGFDYGSSSIMPDSTGQVPVNSDVAGSNVIDLIFFVIDGNGGFEVWPLSAQIKCTDEKGNVLTGSTGESGRAVIKAYPGIWYLEISKPGYKPAAIGATITRNCYVNVTMFPGIIGRSPLLNPSVGDSFISLSNDPPSH